MRKLEKIFWYFFGFFVAYVLVGFKLISYIANDQIIKNIEDNLNAKASIARLEFNPFTFKVKINNFLLKDENKEYLYLKYLVLDVEFINSIKEKTIFINEVLLDNLKVNISQENEEFDIVKLIKEKSNKNINEEKQTENTEIKFLVKSFRIENSNINFIKDKSYKLQITNLTNILENLGNTQNKASNMLSFNIDKNSKIQSNTTITNSNFKDFIVSSDISLKDIDLKKLSDYKKELLKDINIKSLLLNTKINLEFKTSDNSLIVNTKDTIVSKIDVSKAKQIDFKAKNLTLKSSNFDLKNNYLILENIALNNSNFRQDTNIKFKAKELLVANTKLDLKNTNVKIGDINLNSADISYIHLKSEKSEEETNSKVKKSNDENNVAFSILTNNIKINNSNLNFEDRTIKVPFKANIQELNGFVSSLNTKENIVSDLKVNGIINKYATTNIDAKVNLNNVKILSDIDFKIKNLNINDFTPYSREFIAQDIDEGKLDINLKYNIQNSNLDAKNNIVVKKIKLGKTYEIQGVETLPLGIAISLLEDSNDEIKIDLPISGNLDDPEFSVAPIVWKAFTNLIFKAITAPFSLLGALFDFSDDEINKVTFDFNNTNIGPVQKEPLDKLVKILTNRPNMALEYANKFNSTLEREKILVEKYQNILNKKDKNISLNNYLLENYKKINGEEKTTNLLKKYEKKSEKLTEYLVDYTKSNIKITENDFEKIALNRGLNIKEYLIKNGVKENQVIINKDIKEETLQKDSIIIEFKVNTL